MTKLAIVILNWNGKGLLAEFLPSVIQYSDEADIYVADNGSTDDSVAFVRATFPKVKVIENKENGGFAKGYNDALKYVDADIYCLLNSDVEVTKGWLGPVLSQFEASPNTAIIQPKILDYKDRQRFEYAGAAGGFIDKLGYPYCRGRIFQSIEEDEKQYDDIIDIFWATGACMFVRRAVFEALGGFDEDYFAHQEEIDFCWRAHNLGYNVQYVGHSHVYHVGGATMSNMNPLKTFLNFRNSLYSITKNLPKRTVLKLVLIRLLLDGIAAARFVFQFKFSHFYAVLKAHFSFYWNFRRTFKKRGNAKKFTKYQGTTSVVWSYFVHRKEKFSELS
ncbi:glycosyltransferase family 2 protein [Sungkyunkwania multivorans]|uniref:Glycosyltransferase family 2 protein n=1 Tax=Sungkyunkwania multivorans TaxID=1173618 RepID=A0ABW3CXX5_9FLAO